MNDATSEMLNTTFSQMKQIITALHSRIEKLEQDIRIHQDLYQLVENMETKIANTLANSPQILENLNDRMQKLEDKFDQLSGATDERIDARVQAWMNNNFDDCFDDRKDYHSLQDESDVDSSIERAMEDFDVGDKVDEYLRYNKDVIRDVVKEMTFTVEVE